MFTVRFEGGRKGAREKEREWREMERGSPEGAYTRGRVWPGLPGPASCQRRGQSATGSARRGGDSGGGDPQGGEGRGFRTPELEAAKAGHGHQRPS